MTARLRFLSPAQAELVWDWWYALQPRGEDDPKPNSRFAMFSRRERAGLRRCRAPEQVLLEGAFIRLAQPLLAQEEGKQRPIFVDREGGDPTPYALVAGLLAQVEDGRRDGVSLAARLGQPIEAERPLMSALRFARLQTAASEAEFYQLARRAIQLAERKADVVCLADELLAWVWEFRGNQPDKPRDRLRVRWATAYFTAANKLEAPAEQA